ncbi:ubiquitin-like modifier-activating enzyme ATG7 [Corticium candelabrum]|uniref:ubiquitin-like modifier-activating enzyme ATG7 n=1 Tax=Corticium candelabrum TaxID=121492 RepID=UPI002E275EDC|nr:ubiquitin-like modifier-activating enzyme ATG7 [Corticium candelabrum]
MAGWQPLQFAPFKSVVDAGFWHEVTRRKLEVYQLEETAQALKATYTNGDTVGLPPRLSLEFDAFDDPQIFGVDDEEDDANVVVVCANSYNLEQEAKNTPEMDLEIEGSCSERDPITTDQISQ